MRGALFLLVLARLSDSYSRSPYSTKWRDLITQNFLQLWGAARLCNRTIGSYINAIGAFYLQLLTASALVIRSACLLSATLRPEQYSKACAVLLGGQPRRVRPNVIPPAAPAGRPGTGGPSQQSFRRGGTHRARRGEECSRSAGRHAAAWWHAGSRPAGTSSYSLLDTAAEGKVDECSDRCIAHCRLGLLHSHT
jgi:hypothetical protein